MGIYINGNAPQTCYYGDKEVKKIYLGDALLWPTKKELEYIGTITPLSVARKELAAASVGDYALFGGGYSTMSAVDAYDAALTRTTPEPLSEQRYALATATIGGYALFGGGRFSGSGLVNVVDAYGTDLTRTTPQENLRYARHSLAAAATRTHALFGGGTNSNGYGNAIYNAVEAYDENLTSQAVDGLTYPGRYNLAAAATEHYVMFGGGLAGAKTTTSAVGGPEETTRVDAYDTSLTHTTPTELSFVRERLAAASVGDYILFAGGKTGYSAGAAYPMYSNIVDAYDANLTRTTPTELSVARYEIAAVAINGYAVFGGGKRDMSINFSAAVDVYDANLTRTTPTELSKETTLLAAAAVGNYALFGGGSYMRPTGPTSAMGTDTDTVHAYKLK